MEEQIQLILNVSFSVAVVTVLLIGLFLKEKLNSLTRDGFIGWVFGVVVWYFFLMVTVNFA